MHACRCHTRLCRAALVAALCAAHAAHATTFTVTSVADTAGTCPSPDSCTLRQAITDANAAGGVNTIGFAIAGSGLHTITLGGPLPTSTHDLTIDGYTQPGSVMNTLTPDQGGLDTVLAIEIVGTGNSTGLVIQANTALTVRGLALNHFSDAIIGNGGNPDSSFITVQGCFIGTRADGTAFAGVGNTGSAIRTGFSASQIGGTLPWQRNLLSGNGGAGLFSGAPTTVQGNLIGTDRSGTLAIPNGTATNWGGVIIAAHADVHLGGSDPAARNVISGNHGWGIGLWPAAIAGHPIGDFELKGNFIGTDWSGTRPLPNGFADPAAAKYGGGIQVTPGPVDLGTYPIGGFGVGEANLIVGNDGAGIASSGYPNVYFSNLGNVIHHNRGEHRVNVDLGGFGPTPNDADDADSGANNLQNYPQILAVSRAGDQLTITYRVDSAVGNAAYPLRIDFHENRRGGSGAWLGADTCGAGDAQQPRQVVLDVPAGVRAVPFVATVTDANGYSSEFSPAYDVIYEDDFD